MNPPPSRHLILLHGNLGSWRDWDFIIPPLREKGISCHPLNLWELIASGCSDLEEAGRRIAALALPHAPCALMGYSLGGRLALHAMQAAPQAWSGIAFISTHPGLQTAQERQTRLASDLEQSTRCRRLSPRNFLQHWNRQGVLAGSGYGPSSDYPQELAAQAFDIWSLGRQADMRPHLRDFSGKIVWLAGEQDAKFSALARTIPGITPILVPGAGHRLLQQSPSTILQTALSLFPQE